VRIGASREDYKTFEEYVGFSGLETPQLLLFSLDEDEDAEHTQTSTPLPPQSLRSDMKVVFAL
jgi:hypothetical protein